jgi:hypothetical protein
MTFRDVLPDEHTSLRMHAGPEKQTARKSVASRPVSSCLPSLQSSCILASFSDPEIMTIEKVSLASMEQFGWQ